ncbi:diguanylate cyclase [Symbioplanes lichenis]|uniref:diguanylate cyclase n=1 Tax=Symbioplanes lichenis TaxID=1629072 RepID=UPI002739C81F|nr:diguanylate cyclase [Actinoplanes lichenis]
MGASPSVPAEPAAAQFEPGAYDAGLEVLGEIGRGAQAVVHRVARGGTEYALKQLLADDLDPDRRREFRRQAALLAAITSPHLPRVRQAGEIAGRPYLIMDLVPGEPLSRRLLRGPLDERQAVALGADLASALRAAHEHELVHRDIKPENVLVTEAGAATLVDFGLATMPSGEALGPGDAIAGTLTYCAPEQAGMLNRPVDARSDLYALGAVLFECVTGAPPFAADDVGELLHLHATAPVPDPRALAPGLGATFAAILVKLLAKDPDDRYRGAAGLLADLRRLAAEPGAVFALAGEDCPAVRAETPLTGRDAEFAALRDHWARATGGNGGLVLLHGPAGAGKTRLAAELAAHVATTGGVVLRGGASASDRRPMGPLRAAVDAYVRDLLVAPGGRERAAEIVRAAAGESAALVTNLSPALDDLLAGPELTGEVGFGRHAAAVADLLTGLARTAGPLLLHLDDAQWYDEGTVRVLERLAAAVADVPLLVVATARRDEDKPSPVLGRLTAVRTDEIGLAPFGPADIVELIARMSGGVRLAEPAGAHIATLTGGNPFATVGYARAVMDAGLLRPVWGEWVVDQDGVRDLQLPADSAQLILRRLAGVDESARDLLRIAAVVGTTFDPEVVAEVAGAERRATLDSLDGAIRQGVVEARDGSYRFVHESIRTAAQAGLAAGKVTELHGRIADALDARAGSDAYVLARHCVLAGPAADPQRTLRACTEAGARALAEHAADTALTWLEAARAAAAAGGIHLNCRFKQLLGTAYHHNARFAEAAETLTEALSETSDPMLRAGIQLLLARVHESAGAGAAQLDAVEHGLAELGRTLPAHKLVRVATTFWLVVIGGLCRLTGLGYGTAKGGTRERLRLEATLHHFGASGAIRVMRPGRALLHGMRTVYPVNRLGRSPERARDLAALGVALRFLGLRRPADRLTGNAERLAARLGDPTLTARVDWMTAVAMHGTGGDSGERLRRVLHERDRFLDPGLVLDSYSLLGWEGLLRGEVAEAEAATAGRLRWQDITGHHDRACMIAVEAALLALRGRAGEALTELTRAGAAAREVHEIVHTIMARMVGALERDDLGAAFDDAVAEFEGLGLGVREVLPSHHGFYVYLAYGRLEQARRAAPAEQEKAMRAAEAAVALLGRVTPRPLIAAHHRITRAALAVLTPGGAASALALLTESEELFRTVDAPLTAYEATLVRARALAASGVPGEAERQAYLAASIAEKRGWPHRARKAAAEFRIDAGRRNRLPVAAGRGREGQRWAALEQLSNAASRVIDPERLTRVALDETVRLLGAERALLFLVDSAKGRLTPYVGRDAAGQDLTELKGYSKTVVSKVRQSREPLVVTGTDEGEALGAASVVQFGLRSILVAPLELDDRLLGVVYLDSRVAKGVFTVEDADVLTAITHHIAVGLETARAAQLEVAVAAANRQRDVAETLRRAMARLTGTLDPELVLRRLLLTARQTPGGERGWLLLGTAESAEISVLGSSAGPSSLVLDEHPELRKLFENRQADLTAGTPPWAAALGDWAGTSWLTVTLDDREGMVGVLILASEKEGVYTAAELGVAAALVSQGMVAYDNARMFTRINELATTDSLTGVANRRRFFELAERQLVAALDGRRPVTALMLDIDHFKKINDTYGHQAGDDVIKEVAERVVACVPPDGIVARYGGEEFAVLLPGVADDGPAIAEKVRAAIAGTEVDTRIGDIPVTVSVGLSVLRADDTPDALLARADAGLYEAKQAGRNRVMAHDA